MGMFNTRIVNFAVRPNIVPEGGNVNVVGTLQWFCPWEMCPPFGAWQPYGEASVEIYVDGKKYTVVTTDESGAFSCTLSLKSVGTHYIQAHYPGSWKDNGCWSQVVAITVLSQQDYEKYRDQTILMYGMFAIVGIVLMETVCLVLVRR